MPTDLRILGFVNQWFSLAFATVTRVRLPSRREIRVVTAPCFLGTKLEAFKSRGDGDYQGSKDIEDLLAVIHGRESIVDEVLSAPAELRDYLSDHIQRLLESDAFTSSIEGHLPREDPTIVLGRLAEIAGPGRVPG